MKPIIQEETQDTILTKDITEQHIVVAVINGNPCLLNKGETEPEGKLSFKILNNNFTKGNCYDYPSLECTLKKMVEHAMKDTSDKVAVFHQSDWKQALQWLIDNA